MKNSIREIIETSQFNYEKKYRVVAFFFCPFYLMRKNLYENIKHYAQKMEGSILDFGCGSKPYKELFVHCSDYIGVDIENEGHLHREEQIECYYDGRHLPFENNQFDNIFSSEVIEHIDNIDEILNEINRVLKPGGRLLLTTPFVWNENEIPHDYARYTSFGILALLGKHGFKIIEIRKSMNFIETLYQMKAEYYRKVTDRIGSKFFRRVLRVSIIPLQTFKGMFAGKLFSEDKSLYGNNIVYAVKEV